MQLRIDRLLTTLRDDPETLLEQIDNDPLLIKRANGELVLANASQELYTPQEEHQLYAKGIVYRRNPYRLISLPLLKIYNLGEREVTVDDLTEINAEPDVRLLFLRKLDGALLQVFHEEGQLYFTTRGMIEGASLPSTAREAVHGGFDFLGTARALLERLSPALVANPEQLGRRTLLFEMLHPEAMQVTNYGEREDLVLLTCFDNDECKYLPHRTVAELGTSWGFPVVDALRPSGTTIQEQIAGMLESLEGTDEEGSVLAFEQDDCVIYRVKVKSPDYLRILRAMTECTYSRTVDLVQEHPEWTTWPDFEAFLRERGRDEVPEELLDAYREHFENYHRFLAICEEYRVEVLAKFEALTHELEGTAKDTPEYRKKFAELATRREYSGLLFAVLDARLDLERVCRYCRSLEDAQEKLRQIREE